MGFVAHGSRRKKWTPTPKSRFGCSEQQEMVSVISGKYYFASRELDENSMLPVEIALGVAIKHSIEHIITETLILILT